MAEDDRFDGMFLSVAQQSQVRVNHSIFAMIILQLYRALSRCWIIYLGFFDERQTSLWVLAQVLLRKL